MLLERIPILKLTVGIYVRTTTVYTPVLGRLYRPLPKTQRPHNYLFALTLRYIYARRASVVPRQFLRETG